MKIGQAFLIGYSITARSTINEIPDEIEQIRRVKDTDEVPCIIFANKCDLEDQRVISIEEGQTLAHNLKVLFIETSAKTGHNVDEMFIQLIRHYWALKQANVQSSLGKKTFS